MSNPSQLYRHPTASDTDVDTLNTTLTQAIARPPGSFRALDYSLGGPLNNVLPDGSPSVDFLLLDVPQNHIVEYGVGDQSGTATTVSARLGGNYRPIERFVVTLGQSANVTFGSGNDVLLSTRSIGNSGSGGLPQYLLSETTVNGGSGLDVLEVQAGHSLFVGLHSSSFSSVEGLQFAPDAGATQLQEIALQVLATGAFAFTQVLGSAGIDRLTIEVFPLLPLQAVSLDMRAVTVSGFGDAFVQGDTRYADFISIAFYPAGPDQGVMDVQTVFAPANAALLFTGGRANSHIVGNSRSDQFNLPVQQGAGRGDIVVDGQGEGDNEDNLDVVYLPGPSSAYHYLAGGTVNGQAVEFRLQDQRPVALAGGDGFNGIELFGFSDGFFTPAQLAGGITPQLPSIRFKLAPGQSTALEGTPPQAGGTIRATLERSGDLNQFSTVSWRLLPESAAANPATADDLTLSFGTVYSATFIPGQSQLDLLVPLQADALQEPDEPLWIELTAAQGARLGADTLQRFVIVNDDAFDFSLAGAASSDEGSTYTLRLTPLSAYGFFGADGYRIDWGDGSPLQMLSAPQLLASGGQVTHVFADGAAAPSPATTVSVTALVANGTPPTHELALAVLDVAPTLGVQGPSEVEAVALYTLHLGSYSDPGDDPLQSLRIDWGDGSQSTVAAGAPLAYHLFTTLAVPKIQVFARNDDGEFLVDARTVTVSATAGNALPNGTPFQQSTAWSDAMIGFSHKANFANAAEAWSPVSLGVLNSGVLAGGDLYGGLLGVSGRSANTSSVRQEIDGSEALRIELAGANRANAVVLDLARLFTHDAPGLNESGRVLFYDGASLVGSQMFAASQANGRLHLELAGLAAFNRLVLQAGAVDANNAGAFVPGGMVNALGVYAPAPVLSGSDFMLEAVQFFNLPPQQNITTDGALELIGQPSAHAAVIGPMGFGA